MISLTLILAALVLTLAWDSAEADDSPQLMPVEANEREAASGR